MKHFLSISDLSAGQIEEILRRASRFKTEGFTSPLLSGQALALLFQKPSLRTRAGFELAAKKLGAHTVVFSEPDAGLQHREESRDVARVLSRTFDGLIYRGTQQELDAIVQHSRAPVINALTEREHPCQLLADLLTAQEQFGTFQVPWAYIGDGNNVCRSLIRAARLLSFPLAVAHPKGCGPGEAYLAESAVCQGHGWVSVHETPTAAVQGARVVYTDTWVSMGEEEDAACKEEKFRGFTLDRQLLSRAAEDAVVFHCLPAHRGKEISADLMDSETIWQQAENRFWTAAALLSFLFGK